MPPASVQAGLAQASAGRICKGYSQRQGLTRPIGRWGVGAWTAVQSRLFTCSAFLELRAELREDDAVLAAPPEVGGVRLASQRRGSPSQRGGGQRTPSAARQGREPGAEGCHH